MLTIAGGILLALLFIILLPFLIPLAIGAFGLTVIIAVPVGGYLYIDSQKQDYRREQAKLNAPPVRSSQEMDIIIKPYYQVNKEGYYEYIPTQHKVIVVDCIEKGYDDFNTTLVASYNPVKDKCIKLFKSYNLKRKFGLKEIFATTKQKEN